MGTSSGAHNRELLQADYRSARIGVAAEAPRDGGRTAAHGQLQTLPYESVQALDPLGLDTLLSTLPTMVEGRELARILVALADAVAAMRRLAAPNKLAAFAALRDFEFLLASAHYLSPESYAQVTGLEEVLGRLAAVTETVPRGSVYTYGPCNPSGSRMRTYTATPEEQLFVTGLQASVRGLDQILRNLARIMTTPLDTLEFAEAAAAMRTELEPTITANRDMVRRMPPELFSRRIVVFFGPLDIGGHTCPGNTGAHMPTVGIDYLIFGVSAERYKTYAETNLRAMLPQQRTLVRDAVRRSNGRSMIERLEDEVKRGVAHPKLANESLSELDGFLRRYGTFRRIHLYLARTNLPLRPIQTGSGGHDLSVLDRILSLTDETRMRVKAMRKRIAAVGGA